MIKDAGPDILIAITARGIMVVMQKMKDIIHDREDPHHDHEDPITIAMNKSPSAQFFLRDREPQLRDRDALLCIRKSTALFAPSCSETILKLTRASWDPLKTIPTSAYTI